MRQNRFMFFLLVFFGISWSTSVFAVARLEGEIGQCLGSGVFGYFLWYEYSGASRKDHYYVNEGVLLPIPPPVLGPKSGNVSEPDTGQWGQVGGITVAGKVAQQFGCDVANPTSGTCGSDSDIVTLHYCPCNLGGGGN